jgi:hypothetical protein
MPESGTYGSVRGALSNGRPYRDPRKVGMPLSAEIPAPVSTATRRDWASQSTALFSWVS